MISRMKIWTALLAVIFLSFATTSFASDEPEDPQAAVMHHIGDAHQFHIVGDIYLPLPCIAYSADGGFFFSLSSAFNYSHDAHMSLKAVNGYVLYHDELMRIKGDFPKGVVEISPAGHGDEKSGHDHGHSTTVDEHGVHEDEGHDHAHDDKDGLVDPEIFNGEAGYDEVHVEHHIVYNGKTYYLEPASKLQGITSWYDFSITKNVFSMILAVLLLFAIFGTVAKAYKKNRGKAPKGIQSLLEPIIVFMRDEVIKPAVGDHKWEKFFPYLMSVFFFILFANLLGLIPFFPGSANITGNLGVTLVLAVFTFLVTNFNGNGHYWRHVFAMPGVPLPVLILLTPIEVVGLFIKPITLFIRLFANITAGHIIILSLVSLIFVFSDGGQSMAGAVGGAAVAVPFVFAMNFLELFVAFLQAFIFTLLSAIYIGSAVEEHHHEEAH
jgi:F-type H+-transporting ATPase subunit a